MKETNQCRTHIQQQQQQQHASNILNTHNEMSCVPLHLSMVSIDCWQSKAMQSKSTERMLTDYNAALGSSHGASFDSLRLFFPFSVCISAFGSLFQAIKCLHIYHNCYVIEKECHFLHISKMLIILLLIILIAF